VERSHGSFFRSFGLPETVDPEGISAAIKDGVMTVTVPKRSQEPKPAAKEIHIEG
jgi:HSP20 family protein